MDNKKELLSLLSVVLGILMLTLAAAPIYSVFCKATGFGGITQKFDGQKFTKSDKTIKVFFDSNTDPNLDWKFKPNQLQLEVRPGEHVVVFYTAENNRDKDTKGMAIYNVTPNSMGQYFHKIHCFCFDEQTLYPYEKVQMPVSFVIDPKMFDDPDTADIQSVTLSYTFFKI